MEQRLNEVRRGRSRRFARIAAVLALGVLLVGWRATRPAGDHRPELHAELVAAAARAGDGGTLELAQVADFAWDRAVVFDAYASQADLERGLGFAWSPQSWVEDRLVDSPRPLLSDSYQLLVLVRGEDEVAGWCLLNGEGTPGFLRFVQPSGGLSTTWPEAFQAWEREDARFLVRDVFARPVAKPAGAWTLAPLAR